MVPLLSRRPGVCPTTWFVRWLACAALALSASCAEAPRRARRPARFVAARQLPAAPPAETTVTPDLAATDAAERVLRLVETIRDAVLDTRYQARTDVSVEEGYFAWDCSGMAGWILRRAAPRAFRAMGSRRPLARDFFRAIARAPTTRPRAGWQRIAHVADVRPGDVFAFLRSPLSTTHETGHVGFIVGIPEREGALPNAYTVRIADATAIAHSNDTRDDAGGFGFGTILFMLDESGDTMGYMWAGPDGPELAPSRVVYGRVSR